LVSLTVSPARPAARAVFSDFRETGCRSARQMSTGQGGQPNNAAMQKPPLGMQGQL
jgi:hypothetical protein